VLIRRHDSYEAIVQSFRAAIPDVCNIATLCCTRHADGSGKTALVHVTEPGKAQSYSFDWMEAQSNRFANLLTALGLPRGSRIALLLGQEPATPVVHLGAWKAGMVSLPLSHLFGSEALRHRLADSEAALLVTDRAGLEALAEVRAALPALRHIFLTEGAAAGCQPFWQSLERAQSAFSAAATAPDEPAYINYTSGTTGQPKGVVKGHRSILGLVPSLEFAHDFLPQPGDLSWSPADWAWLAGMTNVLFGPWFHGIPVLAYRRPRFDPDEAMAVMAEQRVRNVLLPPSALKLLRQAAGPRPERLALRSIVSGAEPVGAGLADWAAEALGATVNIVFGQTECNMVLGNNSLVMRPKAGALGRPMPGHRVAILNEAGEPLPPGSRGEIAIARPDPLMMLGYWRQPEATAAKFRGDWMLTGDLGAIDAEGCFWFEARKDDLILSSGYRIGPGEIEDMLLRHPAVVQAAAIGVPDPLKGEAIKAFVQLTPGTAGDEALIQALKQLLRSRLAKHEVPRDFVFMESLPLTSNGKVRRQALREAEAARATAQGALAG